MIDKRGGIMPIGAVELTRHGYCDRIGHCWGGWTTFEIGGGYHLRNQCYVCGLVRQSFESEEDAERRDDT